MEGVEGLGRRLVDRAEHVAVVLDGERAQLALLVCTWYMRTNCALSFHCRVDAARPRGAPAGGRPARLATIAAGGGQGDLRLKSTARRRRQRTDTTRGHATCAPHRGSQT